MKTRCVVFDFDGVLVDSNDLKRNAYYEVFNDVHDAGPLIAEALSEFPEGSRFDVIGLALQKLTSAGLMTQPSGSLPVAKYADRYNTLCEQSVGLAPETRGCSSVLERLAGEVPLYINSATPEEPLRRIVRRRGWAHLFTNVLGWPRSKADNLRSIIEQEGVSAEQVTFVGDTLPDQAAAELCGCRFVGFLSGIDTFPSASTTVTSLIELHGVLEKNANDVRKS